MKALEFSRKPARYAAAVIAGALRPGAGAAVGPLRLRDLDEPELPTDGWVTLRPRLAGICGSDLSTIDGRSSRYFEPIVSFPFVPGHEVVGDLDDGTRAVLVPVLHCEVRGIQPLCAGCASGDVNRCERISFGHLEPGLQTGFCESTGGGWSEVMVAHPAQLVPVPDDLGDEAAVMVEPAACAVHAAEAAVRALDGAAADAPIVVIGAGTLGLLTIAALPAGRPIITAARYPHQKRLATELGATTVVGTDELNGAVRLATRSMKLGTDHASASSPAVQRSSSTASAAKPRSARPWRSSPPAAPSSWSACRPPSPSTSPASGTARSRCAASTRTGARTSTPRSTWSRPRTSAGW